LEEPTFLRTFSSFGNEERTFGVCLRKNQKIIMFIRLLSPNPFMEKADGEETADPTSFRS
jgi:hypothetical protein